MPSKASKPKKSRNKIPSTLIGAAGEHLVLSELFRRGLMAGRAPEGVADVDLLILDEKASVITNIQVKTRTYGSDGGWHMKEKHEHLSSPRLMYVFVDFEPERPVCFVIPSAVVARYIRLDHGTWLATPGKNGQKHKDSKMRRIGPKSKFVRSEFPEGWMDEFRERWNLLSQK